MMRATSNPPNLVSIADAVWDEVLTGGHVIAESAGKKINDVNTNVSIVTVSFSRRTAYAYGPTNLAAGATYVPTAGTIMTAILLDGVANNDFKLVHGTSIMMSSGSAVADNPLVMGYCGFIYCDGTDVGIKNADAAGRDLSIEGFTI